MQRWRAEALACFLFILFSEIRCQKGDPAAGTAGMRLSLQTMGSLKAHQPSYSILLWQTLLPLARVPQGLATCINWKSRELTLLRRLLL